MGRNVGTKKVITNFWWRFAERSGAQLVSLVVSIILARLLTPDIFGTIALIMVFISILNVFVDSGLGNSLIQKKDADEIDFSTVFYFNLGACILLYILMFICAPFIASFYNDISLILIIRVLTTTIVISGIRNVQHAYISRTLQFKRFFFATLGGTVFSAVIGIYMAYGGYGVWALVAQHLANNLVGMIILWLTVKWRPKRNFSFVRFKSLFNYGWKLLVSSLIDTMYREIRQLIIGKMYTASDLGLYNRGQQLPNILVYNINVSIDSILFPVLSQEQDDVGKIKTITRRSIMTSTYILAPMMIGLAAIGEPFVRLVLTEKWLPCVPYLMIFCITFMFYPIHTANLNAVKAMGRSDLFLKLEIIKKVVGIVALLVTMWISVMAMAYSLLFTSVISQIINTWPSKKLFNYGYIEQLKDMIPNMVVAFVMGILVYPIKYLEYADILTLFLQIVLGITIYITLSKILKLESYNYTVDIFKQFVKRQR